MQIRTEFSRITLVLLSSTMMLSGCGGGGSTPPTAQPGSIQFQTTALTVGEVAGGTTASFTVTRTGGNDGAVSVTVARTGTATAGADYTISSTTVSFAAGDAAPKTLSVSVADDGDAEGDETLTMTLTAPTGGATVGANASATLTIKDNESPLAAPVLEPISADIKTLKFGWAAIPGATSYRLLRDPDGTSGFTQVLETSATNASLEIPVHLQDWVRALYRLDACNADGCSSSTPASALAAMVSAIGYFKQSNTAADPGSFQFGDEFGFSAALSADGNTLAVGAVEEDTDATGIDDPDGESEGAQSSGAVYVFARTGAQWSQQAYVKASNTDAGDGFGRALALSSDGKTLAVGARDEDSNGINGDQGNSNNIGIDSGAVYVFTRSGQGQWSQQAYVKASNTGEGDGFGSSLALSGSGDTLAVGALDEDSGAQGVNGEQMSDAITDAGAVYIFTRDAGAQWSQQAYVKASNTQTDANFGSSVALSTNGDTLAVGATGEASGAPGGTQAPLSGAVYVFTRSSQAEWSQQAFLKASNTGAFDRFGSAVALSGDGGTLAVGAHRESSNATDVNGEQTNNDAPVSGAVYVFARSGVLGTLWVQQAYVKASNTETLDAFGSSVALSANGDTLAVGAGSESGGDSGVNGLQTDNSAPAAGAVYVFIRTGADWSQRGYVKASNTQALDSFGGIAEVSGVSVALSGDGETLAVGAPGEDSSATGVDGDQSDNGALGSGAVYLY